MSAEQPIGPVYFGRLTEAGARRLGVEPGQVRFTLEVDGPGTMAADIYRGEERIGSGMVLGEYGIVPDGWNRP